MIRGGDGRFAAAFEDRFSRLLRSASELLGIQIEIWDGKPEAIFAQSLPARCADCSLNSPDHHRACRERRSREGRKDHEPRRWTCPHGCDVAILPMRTHDDPVARLVAVRPAGSRLESAPDSREMSFLSQLTEMLNDHLVVSHELTRVEADLTRRQAELHLLYTVSGRIDDGHDARTAIRMLLEQVRRAVGASAAFVSIPERRIFEAAADPGGSPPAGTHSLHRLAAAIEEHLGETKRTVLSGSPTDLGFRDRDLDWPAQVLAVSLGDHGRRVGVLGLIQSNPRARPRVGDLRLLESLSERIVMATANGDKVDELKEFLMSTVKSLVSAIEAKDPYTSGHSERVNLLSMLIGKKMGLSDEDLEILRWASILHDVGKIGMPEGILKKPGRLTPDEYEIMKTHPERGYQVLSPIRQLAAASQAVRAHHEWYDGHGYPMGLKGEEIPLRARIIAVADTYDALTSTRSYRMRRSPDAAFEVIREASGTQLDPKVVETLGELIPFIREHEVMIRGAGVEADQEMDEAQEVREAA